MAGTGIPETGFRDVTQELGQLSRNHASAQRHRFNGQGSRTGIVSHTQEFEKQELEKQEFETSKFLCAKIPVSYITGQRS